MSFNADHYVHPTDKAALKALKTIPGFHQVIKAFMKIWSERQFRISNMSSCIKITETQLAKYYDMLPPICEKLGIDVPELYLKLDVSPNSYTSGDTKPFIVVTSGLFETIPEELIPTVLAHECGHIACHHVLYNTMGQLLLGVTSEVLKIYIPFSGIAMLPLEIAFFYWMRCSELSADRAAVLCDGTAEKMSEVCMRFAGYDKDIRAIASKEQFMAQAEEYRNMIKANAWDKTLEFLTLSNMTHPLTTVRALECEEWAKTDQFMKILNNTYEQQEVSDPLAVITKIDIDEHKPTEQKDRPKLEFPKFIKREKEDPSVSEKTASFSAIDEIREYKALMDEGIISEEEFNAKKKQLLGL